MISVLREESTMSEIERLTITLPAEMAAVVKSAVETGDYASTSEVVRAALRDWKMKRALQVEELAALKADIDAGLTDVAAGRVKDFDATRIVASGRKLSAVRSPSILERHEPARALALALASISGPSHGRQRPGAHSLPRILRRQHS